MKAFVLVAIFLISPFLFAQVDSSADEQSVSYVDSIFARETRPACTSDLECPFDKICNEGICLSPGVPPDHGECSFDSDCAIGKSCVNGACRR